MFRHGTFVQGKKTFLLLLLIPFQLKNKRNNIRTFKFAAHRFRYLLFPVLYTLTHRCCNDRHGGTVYIKAGETLKLRLLRSLWYLFKIDIHEISRSISESLLMLLEISFSTTDEKKKKKHPIMDGDGKTSIRGQKKKKKIIFMQMHLCADEWTGKKVWYPPRPRLYYTQLPGPLCI